MTNALNLNAPVDTLAMEFTREFDAPVEALFRAHAEPDLIKQWLGPRDLEMTIEHWDFKTGGGYRYVHTTPEGESFAFNGVFHSVRDRSRARPPTNRATWWRGGCRADGFTSHICRPGEPSRQSARPRPKGSP